MADDYSCPACHRDLGVETGACPHCGATLPADLHIPHNRVVAGLTTSEVDLAHLNRILQPIFDRHFNGTGCSECAYANMIFEFKFILHHAGIDEMTGGTFCADHDPLTPEEYEQLYRRPTQGERA